MFARRGYSAIFLCSLLGQVLTSSVPANAQTTTANPAAPSRSAGSEISQPWLLGERGDSSGQVSPEWIAASLLRWETPDQPFASETKSGEHSSPSQVIAAAHFEDPPATGAEEAPQLLNCESAPAACSTCQPQPTDAPCIECPHATMLNPYSNIYLFGTMKLDMLFNGARPVSPGVPFFLAPGSLTGLNQNTVDIHARQTTLGAAFVGPKLGDFQIGGTVVGMLFNDNVIADRYGFLPLQAYGELKNDDWRMAAGLQFDVFAPGLPTMLPFSALAASGNAGNSFRGQLRLERFVHLSSDAQLTLQTALSEPISTTIDPTFRVSEDNGWPNVEGRVALGLGAIEGAGAAARRPFEFGISGVVGQIRTTPLPPGERVVANVWGLAADGRWKITEQFGFAGEVYTGQTLGTYNGAILQEINVDTLRGIRTSGGWLETFYYWTPRLHTHVGYGVDDPIDADVAATATALGRTFNSTIFANLLWDLNQSLRIGFEATWRETHYKAIENPDNSGAGFHTQVQWTF